MKIKFDDYKRVVPELIKQHATFEVYGIKNVLDVSRDIEHMIELQNLTCRVYTKKRIVAGLTLGILSLASIAVHNIITSNPDYEVARDLVNNRIEVIWKNKKGENNEIQK